MIKYFTEITEWNGDWPNHTYLIDDTISKDKIIGYIKKGTEKVIMFKSPIKFFRSKRKFKISTKHKLALTEWNEFNDMVKAS